MVDYPATSFNAMGSEITVQTDLPAEIASKLYDQIKQTFKDIENLASRFNPESALSKMNANLPHSQTIPEPLLNIIKEAYYAYQTTDGNFDPRILQTLNNLGYEKTFEKNQHATTTVPTIIAETWKPILENPAVTLGAYPIDLGGIGKSYTAWLASNHIEALTNNYCLNAGGDMLLSGVNPDGEDWKIGVENPYKQTEEPIAVIQITDTAIATSSIAKRNWTNDDGSKAHHLINPKTGLPVNTGIVAITTMHPDVVTAEIWSKSLFMHTDEEILEITENLQMPVLWFREDETIYMNHLMRGALIWTATPIE